MATSEITLQNAPGDEQRDGTVRMPCIACD